jgi:hypothetical protein
LAEKKSTDKPSEGKESEPDLADVAAKALGAEKQLEQARAAAEFDELARSKSPFLYPFLLGGLAFTVVALIIWSLYVRVPFVAPVGTIVTWGGLEIPQGWLPCDGRKIAIVDRGDAGMHPPIPGLHEVLATTWGGDESQNFFRIPDLRGYFLRGVPGDSGRDPLGEGRLVGSSQSDTILNHRHLSPPAVPGNSSSGGNFLTAGSASGSPPHPAGEHGHFMDHDSGAPGLLQANGHMAPQTGFVASGLAVENESRPKNVAVHFIIKVK